MAILNVQDLTNEGLEIVFSAFDPKGDFFTNDGKTYIHVKNLSLTTNCVVIFDSLKLCDQGHNHDLEIVVGAGEEKVIGFFSKKRYNGADNLIQINYANASNVLVAAVRVV